MNIILIGFKKSGKTSIGKILSGILEKDFFDIDDIIIELFFKKYKERRPIFEIYQFLKEKKFRELENSAFFYLKEKRDSIIATGGGSILNEGNFSFFKNKCFIYLKAPLEELKKRIHEGEDSIFKGVFLEKAYQKREGLYAKKAHLTILTKDKDFEQTAQEIQKKILCRIHLEKFLRLQLLESRINSI